MEYIIINESINKELVYYSAIIIETICEPPTSLIDKIGDELKKRNISGEILIDSLLYSGNSNERFIKANFVDGEFDKGSFSFIRVPRGSIERKISSEYLRNKVDLLWSSCLTEMQKKLIIKGCNL
jgi:hypothetical protein